MAAVAPVVFIGAFAVRSTIQKRSTGDSGLRAGALRADGGSLEWWAGSSSWRSCSLGAPIAELAGYNPLTTYTWLRGGNVAPE